jgi:ubiquinol-cytochrome c reductase cytochrome c1 subunit
MIRIISILGGLFMVAALAWSLLWGGIQFASEGLPKSVERSFHKAPRHLALASDGAFGHFDNQQLQRGFQVYQEVCAACHALGQVSYRDLAALGYNEDEVKAIAAKAQVPAYNPKTGEVTVKPGLPTDKFPPVIYGGQGTPPDLSLMTKARHHGPAYVYSLLTGYADQPADLLKQYPEAKTGEGLHYNPYFANLNIAMAPPLTGEGQVTYSDGTKATVDQMAKDVSAFLVWTAEPSLPKQRQTGWPVLGFLLFATVLTYMAYRNIWADKKH